MRPVIDHDIAVRGWHFTKKNRLKAIRTGTDACAEHEAGIKGLLNVFCPHRDEREGLSRFQMDSDNRMNHVHWYEDDKRVALILMAKRSREWVQANELHLVDEFDLRKRFKYSGDQYLASSGWDSDGLVLVVSKSDKHRTKGLRQMYEAIEQGWALIGGLSKHYSGGGIGLYDPRYIDPHILKEADQSLSLSAERA